MLTVIQHNPSCGLGSDTCVQTDIWSDRRTDRNQKALRIVAIVPKRTPDLRRKNIYNPGVTQMHLFSEILLVTCLLFLVVPKFATADSDVTLKISSDPKGQLFTLKKKDGSIAISGHVQTETKIKQNGPCVEFATTGAKAIDVLENCIDFGDAHLYGGPEQRHQYWPLDNITYNEYSYITKQDDNVGVAEPYWLTSKGVYIYVHEGAPLFIDMNHKANKQLCFIAKSKAPYPTKVTPELSIRVCSYENARVAHQHAIQDILGKPVGIPDERMMRYPIWSTWAKYKSNINEEIVREFADKILHYGFKNAQFEIDDMWEVCYGSHKFDEKKFPNIKKFVKELKEKGFRVTVWIHPFIDTNCSPWYEEARAKGYFIENAPDNSTITVWWDGQSGAIDMTNPAAVKWYVQNLTEVMELTGIDGYKFDAGETSWLPQPPRLNVDPHDSPMKYTEDYVRTVTKFGVMTETRSARHTQDLPNFVRMLDKDTYWDFNNGLQTLITTLFQINLVGYPFVLPDMIGGNGYNENPSKELFIRWTQATVFMLSMQYSYVPWDYDDETVQICKKYTELHAQYADKIIDVAKRATKDGSPVNPPIWWIDPTDETALMLNSEYLLGEDILVAPVLVEGARSRDIYLPKGQWQDQLRGKTITGPTWLRNYSVALNELAYFIKVPSTHSK